MSDQTDVLQGTLDLLIMRTIALEPMHGWAIAQRIQQISDDLLRVQQGSLYPALHRLEHQGWITADWGVSENNRRARFYALTKAGPQAARGRGLEVGPPLGRRQPRAAEDLTVRLWHILHSRLRSLFLRARRESELREELELHLEREQERLEADRHAPRRGTPAGAPNLRRRRVDQGRLPRCTRHGAARQPGPRRPLRGPLVPPGAAGGPDDCDDRGARPRAGGRRVHDLQRSSSFASTKSATPTSCSRSSVRARPTRSPRPSRARSTTRSCARPASSPMPSRRRRTSTPGSRAAAWRARSSPATSSRCSASSAARGRTLTPADDEPGGRSGHRPQPSRLVAALRQRSRRARPHGPGERRVVPRRRRDAARLSRTHGRSAGLLGAALPPRPLPPRRAGR